MANLGLSTFVTEKNKEGLSYLGFSYRRGYTAANGSISWRCIDKPNCSGRLKTDARKRHPELTTEHDHLPNPERAEVRRVVKNMRTRSEQETVAIPTIYRQEARLANQPATAAMMPVFRNLSSTLYRKRQSHYPQLPQNRAALVIPQAFQQTTVGTQFYLGSAQQNDCVIFATADNLRRLCAANLISIDGTFDVAPRTLFVQLYTLHAFEGERLLFYILKVSLYARDLDIYLYICFISRSCRLTHCSR
jgi:hypothetical protein